MPRKSMIAGVVLCAVIAGAMIVAIERRMGGTERAPVKSAVPAAGKTAEPSGSGDHDDAEPVRSYEINSKTGEKQFLR